MSLFDSIKTIGAEISKAATNITPWVINKVESNATVSTVLEDVHAVASAVEQATAPGGQAWSLLSQANDAATLLKQVSVPNSPKVAELTRTEVGKIITKTLADVLPPGNPLYTLDLIVTGRLELETRNVAIRLTLDRINQLESIGPIPQLLKLGNAVASVVADGTEVGGFIWMEFSRTPHTIQEWQLMSQLHQGASLLERLSAPNSPLVTSIVHDEVSYIVSQSLASVYNNPLAAAINLVTGQLNATIIAAGTHAALYRLNQVEGTGMIPELLKIANAAASTAEQVTVPGGQAEALLRLTHHAASVVEQLTAPHASTLAETQMDYINSKAGAQPLADSFDFINHLMA
jgi:hypothetical protein